MKLIFALFVSAIGVLYTYSHAQNTQQAHSSWSSSSESRKYNFALVTRDGNVSNWGDMGSFNTDSLRSRTKEDTLYVRKDGDLYAITDRATVDQAKADMEPMQKLGKQMGELGKQQGVIGKEQGKVGAKEGELGRKMGELGRQMGEKVRNGESTKEIDAQMKELSAQMQALGKEMSAIGEKHKPLSSKMGELGHQMGAAAKEADAKITKLIDGAFARGLAHKV